MDLARTLGCEAEFKPLRGLKADPEKVPKKIPSGSGTLKGGRGEKSEWNFQNLKPEIIRGPALPFVVFPLNCGDGQECPSAPFGLRIQDLICEGIRVEDVPTEGVFLQDFTTAAHANHDEGPVVKGGEVLAARATLSDIFQTAFFIPGPINPGAFVQRVPSSELFGDLSVGLIHAGNKNASNSTRSPITSKTSMSVIPCFFMGIVFASQYAWLLSMIIQFDPIEKNFFAEFSDGEER